MENIIFFIVAQENNIYSWESLKFKCRFKSVEEIIKHAVYHLLEFANIFFNDYDRQNDLKMVQHIEYLKQLENTNDLYSKIKIVQK